MITYFIKSGILLFVFYAVYKLLLENEKMFRFNRAYLLGSLLFSFVIPLQLFAFKPLFENTLNTIQLEEIVIRANRISFNETYILHNIFNILSQVYVVVAIVMTLQFVLNLVSFFRKLRSKNIQLINGEKVILIEESTLPHSFWNAIFINKKEFEMGKIPNELIVHEKAHLQQKHTLDILFIEILQIVFWFNPVIYLFKKAIKLNHEFLADEAVNKKFNSVSDYQNLLLDFAFNKQIISLASTINYLITKKRLLMMTKKESQIKVVFKICAVSVIGALVLFVFSTKSIAQTNDLNKQDYKINETKNVTEPQFPGGIEEFYKFVGENFKMPEEAAKNKIETRIVMQFMVEKDGSLSEIKIVKNAGYGLDKEAIRVLELSPKWIPGSEEGKPVRVLYSLPITIQTAK